ncbi:MAG: short-chain dehydrogenase/reductase [Actinomycetia bacterium]|nr:short-chain dehydrogenase/reductase [Actinomycetes bacterium]
MTAFVEIPGSVAIVSGAGSGIGRASAHSLAKRGASVVVTDVNGERAESVAGEITAVGGAAIWAQCDVTDGDAIERVRDLALHELGHLEIVMNNVGVLAMGPPETLPFELWQRIIEINLLSVVRSNLVYLPHLLAQGRGHVVNTASASGLLAHGFDRLPYVTTKHAVVGMTESLALYLRPRGIGVTCLCPSGVVTNIVEQITFFGEPATPRSPDHPVVEAEVVGELVADAIETGRFLVLTATEVQDEVVARARDIDAYIDSYTQGDPA